MSQNFCGEKVKMEAGMQRSVTPHSLRGLHVSQATLHCQSHSWPSFACSHPQSGKCSQAYAPPLVQAGESLAYLLDKPRQDACSRLPSGQTEAGTWLSSFPSSVLLLCCFSFASAGARHLPANLRLCFPETCAQTPVRLGKAWYDSKPQHCLG